MCKINRRQLGALREFSEKADKYGALPVDEWTSGKGRFTKPRALPPFCKRFEREAFETWAWDALAGAELPDVAR